jgi:hypothetical protein
MEAPVESDDESRNDVGGLKHYLSDAGLSHTLILRFFQQFDKDEDGYLDLAELSAAMRSWGFRVCSRRAVVDVIPSTAHNCCFRAPKWKHVK